ncbi:hypothetical protein Lalb_Chr09g0325551 [Lupinus albus]|uniref:Uncharacterized protein n=1 Tax=Lupinus albus TaxID=3870 RepID=A0A6A4Q057_LUPAL|nr:hypothetical protein Lalb_Chr09g0325551 [Lupinus albus]
MQRQSLGSPSSKLHNHGVNKEEQEEHPKTHRLSLPLLTPHKFVHFIPIITLLCFFVLYLSSHPPSPSDMEQFPRLKHTYHDPLVREIEQHYMDGKGSDVLALRTLRNLQQIRLHRKLADF